MSKLTDNSKGKILFPTRSRSSFLNVVGSKDRGKGGRVPHTSVPWQSKNVNPTSGPSSQEDSCKPNGILLSSALGIWKNLSHMHYFRLVFPKVPTPSEKTRRRDVFLLAPRDSSRSLRLARFAPIHGFNGEIAGSIIWKWGQTCILKTLSFQRILF